MRTKKLCIGLLVGALLFNTATIKSLAAEDNSTSQNETIQTEATLEQNTEQAENVINNETKSDEVIPTQESAADKIVTESVEETTTGEEVVTETPIEESDAELAAKEEKAAKEKASREKAAKAKEAKAAKAKAAKEKATKEKEESYSKEDLKYLACLIYTEAGNQSRSGKIAVGNVVLNRVNSNSYKDSIYGVIHQSGQFGVVRNGSFASAVSRYESGRFNSASEKACIEAAKAALTGENVVGKRLSFTRYSSSLARRYPSGVKIQDHYFY